MKITSALCLLWAILLFAAGCYKDTPPHLDGATDAPADPVPDDGPGPDLPPDSPCLSPLEPVFQGLDYADTIPAHSPFTLTIHHELVLYPSAALSMSGTRLDITLWGTACTCDPCPVNTPELSVTTLNVDGLEAGLYEIVIQGHTYPLLVTDECERHDLYVNGYGTCAEEIRLNETLLVEFGGTGWGCGCGGTVDTRTSISAPWSGGTGQVAIAAEEVICDPSLCCEMCGCIDVFNVSVPVTFTETGMYNVFANDQYLCFTAVFGEDGCADWAAAWTSIYDYPAEVFYGDPVPIGLYMSVGYCCGGEPYVVEERPGENRIDLRPFQTVCEGDCCYMCDCDGSIEVRHVLTDLAPGLNHVCAIGLDSESCIEIFVNAVR
jgi:hypothetical protein